jgi:hypothetical protein
MSNAKEMHVSVKQTTITGLMFTRRGEAEEKPEHAWERQKWGLM